MVDALESMGEHTTTEQFIIPVFVFKISKMSRLVLKPFLKPYWFPEMILLVSM